MLVETNMEEMTDEGLRMAALRFEMLFRQTGRDEYARLADDADAVRMSRMLAAPNPYERGDLNVSTSNPSVRRLIEEHRALKRAGVKSFAVRQRMITLAHLRKHDFPAWVKARGDMDVFDVIHLDGEEMKERLVPMML